MDNAPNRTNLSFSGKGDKENMIEHAQRWRDMAILAKLRPHKLITLS